MVLLEVKDVSKYFSRNRHDSTNEREAFTALEKVNIYVKKNETVGLVGESGSGKSTLAKIILHLLQPNKGAVFYNETNINVLVQKNNLKFRKNIQIVFQNPFNSLDPRQRIHNILKEGIDIHFSELSEIEKNTRIRQALTDVCLDRNALDKFPHEFSGGERQRIAIARAMSLEPELVILDEPVSSLDISVQAQIINMLIDLQKKHEMAYLFISHDLNIVRFLCDRVYVMEGGHIVEEGATERIFTKPLHSYTKNLLNAIMKIPFGN